jgi:hypothetical protein
MKDIKELEYHTVFGQNVVLFSIFLFSISDALREVVFPQ